MFLQITCFTPCKCSIGSTRLYRSLLQFARRENKSPVRAANHLCDNKTQMKYHIERIAEFRQESRKTRTFGIYLIVVLAIFAALYITRRK